MKRLLPIVLAMAAMSWVALPARADLCDQCKGKPYTEDARKCPICKTGWTGSGMFKMCRVCSKKLNQCERCRAALGGKGPVKPTAPQDVVRLSDGDNGKTVKIPQGGKVVVSLKGNPTTGYSWSLTSIQGDAVRMAGKPKYVRRPTPRRMVGSGGVFELTFTGALPGTATVKLGYARPWEKGKPPIKTFAMTVTVGKSGGAADQAKLTAARAAALRADLSSFRLYLIYSGDQDKPFYNLLVSGAKPKSGSPGLNRKGFQLTVYATKRQVEKLIEHLAESGHLGRAKDARAGAIDVADDQAYMLRIFGGPKDKTLDLREDLGWNKPLLDKLDALRKPMFGPTAEGMDKLLGRLSGFRKK